MDERLRRRDSCEDVPAGINHETEPAPSTGTGSMKKSYSVALVRMWPRRGCLPVNAHVIDHRRSGSIALRHLGGESSRRGHGFDTGGLAGAESRAGQ